jgi:UDP-glucose 4-epimerase
MKVLITGGAGFIGSHTVVELQQNGYETVIVDNLSNSNKDVLDRIKMITGVKPTFYPIDVCSSDELEKVLSGEGQIDAVIHFAAFKAVGESVSDPLRYYRNNLLSMITLLEAMLEKHIPNVIFSSSATVYGQPDVLPASEKTPVQEAESPYGNTKQINEEILRDSISAYPELRGISLRYFNPIGAHPSGLIGELPIGTPNNLMPFITQCAIGKQKQLKVFGNDYNTPDGTAIRDYIHVVDLAKAHVNAMQRLIEGKNDAPYEIFNLGTGNGFSVLEVIRSFEKMSGLSLNYEIVDRREGDVEKIFASTEKANRDLGWKASLSLDDMTASAWNWEQMLNKKFERD